MNNRSLIPLFYAFAACFTSLKIQATAFELHRSSGFQPSTVSRRALSDGVHLNEHRPETITGNENYGKKSVNDGLRNGHTASIRSSLAALVVTWTVVVASCSVPAAVAAGSLDERPAAPITTGTTMVASAPATPASSSLESSSAAGNLVLGGWIGISAYAGFKGVWDKYQEFQDGQEKES